MEQIPGGVAVADLRLDHLNPRLPEPIQGSSQIEILRYLDEHDVLDELIQSFIANGFFDNEPLLVVPQGEGGYVVVEGNRRTAALMRLLGHPIAQEAGLALDRDVEQISADVVERLSSVAAFKLDDRDEVARYLGFRHISGLKTWSAEAKARYLWHQVESAVRRGSQQPFYDVGRQVGSNAAGVRNAYNAFNLLRAADSMGLRADIEYVKKSKFGVWTRLLGTASIPKYLGLEGTERAVTYEAVRDKADLLKAPELDEVLQDLKPLPGERRALLVDSRSATDYGDVLMDPRAHAVLREFHSLALATQVLEQGKLAERLEDLGNEIEVLTREVPRMNEPTEIEIEAARQLVTLARALLAVVRSRAEDEDE